MDQTETKFLRTQSLRPMVGFRYIDAVSIFEFMGKENLKNLWQIFITLMPIFNLRQQMFFSFLDLDVVLSNERLERTVHVNSTDTHQYLHNSSSHREHAK